MYTNITHTHTKRKRKKNEKCHVISSKNNNKMTISKKIKNIGLARNENC